MLNTFIGNIYIALMHSFITIYKIYDLLRSIIILLVGWRLLYDNNKTYLVQVLFYL